MRDQEVMSSGGPVTRGLRDTLSLPSALAGLAVVGLVAVLLLPEFGAALPPENDPEPNASQLALTALGVLVLTAGYVAAVARAGRWSRASAALTFAYLAGMVLTGLALALSGGLAAGALAIGVGVAAALTLIEGAIGGGADNLVLPVTAAALLTLAL